MKENRHYATGKRKSSIARVWLQKGTGKITINGKDINEYITRETSKMIIMQPLELTNNVGKYDISVNVNGGGMNGQAGAIKHGITKALLLINEVDKPVLKKAGFITRDSRIKERKKYGQRGARRRFQFSKR
jgi:small subunit ribosomal protein S9